MYSYYVSMSGKRQAEHNIRGTHTYRASHNGHGCVVPPGRGMLRAPWGAPPHLPAQEGWSSICPWGRLSSLPIRGTIPPRWGCGFTRQLYPRRCRGLSYSAPDGAAGCHSQPSSVGRACLPTAGLTWLQAAARILNTPNTCPTSADRPSYLCSSVVPSPHQAGYSEGLRGRDSFDVA